jgi:hypothetical protein
VPTIDESVLPLDEDACGAGAALFNTIDDANASIAGTYSWVLKIAAALNFLPNPEYVLMMMADVPSSLSNVAPPVTTVHPSVCFCGSICGLAFTPRRPAANWRQSISKSVFGFAELLSLL